MEYNIAGIIRGSFSMAKIIDLEFLSTNTTSPFEYTFSFSFLQHTSEEEEEY